MNPGSTSPTTSATPLPTGLLALGQRTLPRAAPADGGPAVLPDEGHGHQAPGGGTSAREAGIELPGNLDRLGSVVGGVAHHFNNLLTVILGNADLLATRHARFFRATFGPSLLPALSPTRTPDERLRFMDSFEQRLTRRLARRPAPLNTFVQTIVLAKHIAIT